MSRSNGKSNQPGSESISTAPLPASRKVYIGSRGDVRVAMREIAVSPTREGFAANGRREENPPVTVYDTSGPYTDPNTTIDLR